MGNRYFEFDEPIRWFKAVGNSPSNSWIGRSRVIDTVYEPTRVEPGDQVHALVGGTFVVRKDGSVESGCLRLPKPIFEKSYGGYETDASLLGKMVDCGRCREIEAPAKWIDYNASRTAADDNQLPECMGPVRGAFQPLSPLLLMLEIVAADAGLQAAAEEVGAKWKRIDVGRGTELDSLECAIRIDMPDGGRIEIIARPTDRNVWVRERGFGFADEIRDVGPDKLGLSPEFRNEVVTIFQERELPALFVALTSMVTEGRIHAPEVARP